MSETPVDKNIDVAITRFEDYEPPFLDIQVGDVRGRLSLGDGTRMGLFLLTQTAYCAEAARWLKAARHIGLSERTIGRLLAAREQHQEGE